MIAGRSAAQVHFFDRRDATLNGREKLETEMKELVRTREKKEL